MRNLLIICFLLFNTINLKLITKSPYDYSSYKSKSQDEDLYDTMVASTDSDESAVYITTTSGIITISNTYINKDSGDATNIEYSKLYGVNSALLVQGGSLGLSGGEINTKSKGSIALFATNDASVGVNGGTITTSGDNSGALASSYNGILGLTDTIITTSGNNSPLAALYEEGNVISCVNCNILTKGKRSDLIYAEGNGSGSIVIDSSTGIAEKAKIAAVDGTKIVNIQNGADLKCSGDPIISNINITQSGILLFNSEIKKTDYNMFSCTNSKLGILESSNYYNTAPMFFVTNINTAISLTNCELTFGSNTFIRILALEELGATNYDGSSVTLTLTDQNIEGDFIIDDVSSLTIIMTNSNIKGTINPTNTVNMLYIKLDSNSKITITGNSYATIIVNELNDGSNLINGTYKWTIGTPVPDTDSDIVSDSDITTDIESDIQSDAYSDSDEVSDSVSDIVSDSDKQSDSDIVTDIESDTDTHTDIESDTDKHSDSDIITDIESDTVLPSDSDTDKHTDIESDTDIPFDSDTDKHSDMPSDTDKHSDTDIASDLDTDSESDSDSHSDGHSDSHSDDEHSDSSVQTDSSGKTDSAEGISCSNLMILYFILNILLLLN